MRKIYFILGGCKKVLQVATAPNVAIQSGRKQSQDLTDQAGSADSDQGLFALDFTIKYWLFCQKNARITHDLL